MTENSNATPNAAQSAPSSTLIEFPGVNRNRPAWRKELSERFREIQQRRARESAPDAEAPPRPEAEEVAPERSEAPAASAAAPAARAGEPSKQPRLVPQPEPQELNPIVQAALRRVERARRQTTAPSARAGHGRATAVARAVEEDLEPLVAEEPAGLVQPEKAPAPVKQAQPAERPEPQAKTDAQPEPPRPSPLSVVLPRQPEQAAAAAPAPTPNAPTAATKTPEKVAAPASEAAKVVDRGRVEASAEARAESADKPKPRHISGVIDDFWLERHGSDALPKVETAGASYDDRAPVLKRLSAAVVDFLAVLVLSVPGAAVIELTNGDWADARTLSSMGGIVAVVMFLYHTCAVALAGRTLGMGAFSLHAVDANTARVPTTGQCVRRAFFYIVSLAAFGLGLLYALIDAERRTAHDILSGTVVVTE